MLGLNSTPPGGGHHRVHGEHELGLAIRRGLREDLLRGLEVLFIQQRMADLFALRLEEGVGHPAADDEGVHLRHQVGDHVNLRLGAAEDGDEGAGGIVQHARQHLDLFAHQQAGDRGLEVLGHDRGGGVRAMRGAEGVVHPDVGQTGQLLGELLVALLFFRVEAEVLEHHHVARLHLLDRGLDFRARRNPGASSPGGRATRRGARRPGRGTAQDRACPSGGRGGRRRSARRRARGDTAESAAPRECGCRR